MRCLAVLFAVAAVAGFASAASAGKKIHLAQSSATTNCMMTCNSQAAACQTTCVVPGTAPTNAATTDQQCDFKRFVRRSTARPSRSVVRRPAPENRPRRDRPGIKLPRLT